MSIHRNRALTRTASSLLFATLVIVTVLGSRVLIDAIESRADDARARLLGTVEELAAQRIEWETVSPSVLRQIQFYGVRLSDDAVARRVSVGIDIPSLIFRRNSGIQPVISIDRARIDLTSAAAQRRLDDTIAFFQSIRTGTPRLTIRITDASIRYQQDDNQITVTRLNGGIQLAPTGEISIGLRSGAEFSQTGAPTERAFSATGGLVIELERTRRGRPIQASLDITDIESSHFTAADQSFHVAIENGEIAVQRVRSETPLDLSASVDPDAETVTVAVRAAAFTPADMVDLRGPLDPLEPWLQSPVTTDSSATIAFDGTIIESSGTLETILRNDAVLATPIGVDGAYGIRGDTVRIEDTTLTVGGGFALLDGTYVFGEPGANATIRARGVRYGELPRIDGTFVLSSTAGRTGLTSSSVQIDDTAVYNVVAEYTPLENRHTVAATLSFDPDGESRVSADVNFANANDFTGRAELSRVSTERVASLANAFDYSVTLPAEVSSLVVSGEARFDRRGDDESLVVPFVVVTDTEDPDRIATGRGSYRNGTIAVDRYALRYGAVNAGGDALIRIGSGGTVDFETDFSINRQAYSLRGLYTPGDSLLIVGPYDIQLRVTRSRRGAIRVRAGALEVPVPIGNASVSAGIDGLFLSPEDWFLTIQDFAISDLPMPAGGTGSASLAVSLTPGGVDLVLLDFTDPVGTLTGSFQFSYDFATTREVRGSGRIASLDGREQYRLVGRVVDDTVALDIRFSDAPLRRLDREVRSGRLDGAIQVVGSPESPQFRAYIESDTVRVGGQEARVQLRAYTDDKVLRLSEAEFVVASRNVAIDEVVVNRESGEISGDLLLSPPGGAAPVSISLAGRTDPIPDLRGISLDTTPVSLTVETESERSTMNSEGEEERSVERHRYSLAKTVGRVDVRRADGGITATLRDNGDFSVELTQPLPISAVATGTVAAGEIELTASGIRIDLSQMGGATTGEPVSIEGGTITGSMRILGAIADPDLFGTLRVHDAVVSTAFSPERIEPFDAAMILENKSIRIPRFQTTVGNAPIAVGGTVLLSRLSLDEYMINVELPGPEGAHVVSTFGPIDVDGYGRGNLSIQGRPRDLLVAGDITVSGAEVGVIAEPEDPPDAGDVNVNVDLQFTTGRAVRFIWPAADFPVIRSNFAVDQTVALSIDGVDDTFSLVGDIAIQSGDVFYFDRNFLIREGQISFQEDETQFDPRVSARAELREVTPEGPVRIYLVADGQRLSEFSPRFESNPPLGGTEIVAILGGNIFQQGPDENTNLSTALLSTSDIVTQFGVFREFENAMRARLDLDLFAIRTSVIQNLVLTAITPTDETTEPVAPTLGTYLNNTSIFMGRYIGESVFGQAILQMRSADFGNPREEDDGIQRLGGVLIDSEISLEWQTPFFMLEWNLAPENPEELFIRDNTFTFSWSFTY